MVREVVDLVPGDLLRQEPLRARQLRELRQRPGVAEGVREPHLRAGDAEPVAVVRAAVEQLAAHRLAAGQVGVGLDPHAADGDDAAAGDGRAQPLEQLGVVLLDPRRVLRRGEGEAVLRVEVEQAQLVGDGAGRLAAGLAQRPQPGGVDVRVADGRQRVRRGRGGAGEDVGELPERGDVGGNLPHLLVHDDEVGPAQRVQRRGACRRLLAELRLDERGIAEHDGVRGSLEVELEPAVGTRFDGDPLVPGVVRLDDAAVGPEDEPLALEPGGGVLAAEVDDSLERLSPEALRDGPAEAHPGRPPCRSPRASDLERLVVEGQPDGGRDGLALSDDAGNRPDRVGPGRVGQRGDGHLQPGDDAHLGRAYLLREVTGHSPVEDGRVVVHEGPPDGGGAVRSS